MKFSIDVTEGLAEQSHLYHSGEVTMSTYHSPSLHEEPRNQRMKTIPTAPRESLLNWLESSGRFRSSETDESPDYPITEELDSYLEADSYALDQEEEEEEEEEESG